MVIRQANAVRTLGNKIALTHQRLEAIRIGLVNYVAVTGRLPCPAPYAIGTGNAAPAGSNNTCNVAALANLSTGAVPWNELGMSSSDALDGWSRKISYRVFAGNAIANGGKLITVNDIDVVPALVPNIAFVLISHGETGYGAWLAGGTQLALAPVNGQEVANAGNGLAYFRRNFSGYLNPPVAPTDPTFFDDHVVYMTVNDVRAAVGR